MGSFFIMATLINTVISDVLELISDLRGESTTNTNASRIRAVSRANQTIAKKRLWKFYRKELTVTANGTDQDFTIGSTTYEMRPGGLSEVYVGGITEDCKYQLIKFEDYKYLITQDASSLLAYEWYDAANDAWKVHLSQIPVTATVIYYTFYFLPPKKTTTAQYVMSPDIDIIARYALAYIYEGEDEDKYQTELQMAEAMMAKYESDDDAIPKGQQVTFGVSNSVGGIGTY
jgi:hypothetical protein